MKLKKTSILYIRYILPTVFLDLHNKIRFFLFKVNIAFPPLQTHCFLGVNSSERFHVNLFLALKQ